MINLAKNTEFKTCVAVAAFSDIGMEIYGKSDNFELSDIELIKISNYYSVILGVGESRGLYGPLPVAYHIDWLLFLYSFELKNPEVKDERVIQEGGVVPACILIFFPTSIDGIASQCRKELIETLEQWSSKIQSVKDLNTEIIKELEYVIESILNNEYDKITTHEKKNDAAIVASKSLSLLQTVVLKNREEKEINLLIIGSRDLLFKTIQKAIVYNFNIVQEYKVVKEKTVIELRLKKVKITLLNVKNDPQLIERYLTKDLKGILYFGDFSNEKNANIHLEKLQKMISVEPKDCVICFVISGGNVPTDVSKTKLPKILQEATGRTISLLDLARKSMSIELSIIEFVDRVIDAITKESST